MGKNSKAFIDAILANKRISAEDFLKEVEEISLVDYEARLKSRLDEIKRYREQRAISLENEKHIAMA